MTPPPNGRLDHVALAVPDLAAALALWSGPLGGAIGAAADAPRDLPEHGVRVAFVRLANTTLELMEPLGDASPIGEFLRRHPRGGLHHVCFAVPDLAVATAALAKGGARPIGAPRTGAHGRPVLFLHPATTQGTLVELEEV